MLFAMAFWTMWAVFVLLIWTVPELKRIAKALEVCADCARQEPQK